MRVLICGSRTWNRLEEIASVIERLPKDTTIIHGAARGADSIAGACAEVAGLKVMAFPVTDEEWKTIGKGAGHIRNKRMLDEGKPDVVIAFMDTDSESRGTTHMINLAESFGVRVVVVKRSCSASTQSES
jgi:hypothetical protein